MNGHRESRRRGTRLLQTIILLSVAGTVIPEVALAQAIPARGRFSLYTGWSERESSDGTTSDLTEVIADLALESNPNSEGIFEYALDVRVAGYPSTNRDQRVSIWEAYVGLQSRDGRWSARLGNMWVRELGGLGSVGGIHGEYRLPSRSAIGLVRFGLFAGLEPESYDAGYVDGVRKGGVYAAVEGDHGRRHVLGYITLRNSSLTERSVVVLNNYIPIANKLHIYQALEYDTQGPGELGDSGLTYIFVNLRYSPSRVVDLQGTYHRGRSIDTRSITQVQIEGRPVSLESLQGLLFESGRARVTVRPIRTVSLWASYGQDQNNRGDSTRDRFQIGATARRVLDTGFDVTVASSHSAEGDETCDSLHASIGTSVGSRTYLSLDYNESVAVYHYDDGDGGTIEVRPNTARYSLSCNLNLNRALSFLLVAEMLESDDFDEHRVLGGIVFRI